MNNKGNILVGGTIIILGLVLLTSNIFHINIWAICWPTGLILLGILVITRERFISPNTEVDFRIISEIKNPKSFDLSNKEYWAFIGNIRLDLSNAEIQNGTTNLDWYGFVSDIKLVIPPEIGLSINSFAFVTNHNIDGVKKESIGTGLSYTTSNYDNAIKKISIRMYNFVSEVKVKTLAD